MIFISQVNLFKRKLKKNDYYDDTGKDIENMMMVLKSRKERRKGKS